MASRPIWGLHMGKQHGSRLIDEGYGFDTLPRGRTRSSS
jgi:hypothetical protein